MSKHAFWMAVASIAPLVATVLIFIGLKAGSTVVAGLGVAIFGLAMLITPILRLSSLEAASAPAQEGE